MDSFREAQKNAGGLVLEQGGRSIFGLIGQLMEDIQERDWTEDFKWKAWKDTCRKIEKMNAGNNARIEGCKVADVQRVFKTIFAEPDRMNVTRFEDVIRYTEYCRRMALFQTTWNITEPVAIKTQNIKPRDNTKEAPLKQFDVSMTHQWPLIIHKLTDTSLTMDEKRSFAGQVRNDLIHQGLWEKKNMEKDLKKVKEQVISILNPQ
ncbi:MAG TPA: hypothetical protein VHY08_24530 [Bacillota bacterium]|nr:hypothetical protein [Bacillota bacterium]